MVKASGQNAEFAVSHRIEIISNRLYGAPVRDHRLQQSQK